MPWSMLYVDYDTPFFGGAGRQTFFSQKTYSTRISGIAPFFDGDV
jgi:hypothetical protein